MALEGRAAVEQEEEQEEEQEQKVPPAADTPPWESEGAPVQPGSRDSGPRPGVCEAAGGVWEGSRGGF